MAPNKYLLRLDALVNARAVSPEDTELVERMLLLTETSREKVLKAPQKAQEPKNTGAS
jgi:hypothetical protein